MVEIGFGVIPLRCARDEPYYEDLLPVARSEQQHLPPHSSYSTPSVLINF